MTAIYAVWDRVRNSRGRSGRCVTVTLEDGKERIYTFGQLLVKAELVAPLHVVLKVADEQPFS